MRSSAFLELNPLRFGAMFSPIWILLAPSLYLYWDRWMADPLLLGLVGGLPILAGLLAATFLRGRWRLEVGPKGLTHHTLIGEEAFEWRRMGPVQLSRRGPGGFFSAFVFAYPVDAEAPQELLSKHLGRSVLAVFGTLGPSATAQWIESQRLALR